MRWIKNSIKCSIQALHNNVYSQIDDNLNLPEKLEDVNFLPLDTKTHSIDDLLVKTDLCTLSKEMRKTYYLGEPWLPPSQPELVLLQSVKLMSG